MSSLSATYSFSPLFKPGCLFWKIHALVIIILQVLLRNLRILLGSPDPEPPEEYENKNGLRNEESNLHLLPQIKSP